MVGADGFSGFWFIYGADLSVVNLFFSAASCLADGHLDWPRRCGNLLAAAR